MPKRKKKNNRIPNVSQNISDQHALSPVDRKIHGFNTHSNEQPQISLKYFDGSHECFSEWPQKDLKAFTDFVNRFNQSNWTTIFQGGGSRGHKTGFGYTKHINRNTLCNIPILREISDDIDPFELRVNQKARVHGFRSNSTFFLVWLDCNHQVFP